MTDLPTLCSLISCFSHLCNWQLGLNELLPVQFRASSTGAGSGGFSCICSEKTVMLTHSWREVLGCEHSQGVAPGQGRPPSAGASHPLSSERSFCLSPEAQPHHAAHTQKADAEEPGQTPASGTSQRLDPSRCFGNCLGLKKSSTMFIYSFIYSHIHSWVCA